MKSKRCAACGQAFRPRPQVSQQCYCSAPACQRERRRRWQQAKRQSHPDYHDNQARAQRACATQAVSPSMGKPAIQDPCSEIAEDCAVHRSFADTSGTCRQLRKKLCHSRKFPESVCI